MVTSKEKVNQFDSGASMLEHFQHFSASLSTTTDLKNLYDLCLSQTKEIFAFNCSTIFLLDEVSHKMVMRATIGLPEELVNTMVLRDGQGLPSLTLKSGKVECVEDFRKEDRFEVTEIISQLDVRSAITAPMMIDNTIFGVLIGHTYAKRVFFENEKKSYQVFANHAAIAIKNAIHISSLYASEKISEKQIQDLQLERERTKEVTNEFESIFSTIATGVIFVKGGRTIARCNDKFAEIFGYPSAEKLVGMSARRIHISDEAYLEFGRKYYSKLISGDVVQTEYALKARDGSHLLCKLSGRAVDQSTPPDLSKGSVWVIDDITRQKAMEDEVLQARKLESIGVLAGGIGHDFNNILSVILGNLGLADRKTSDDSDIGDLIKSALEAAERAKDLTAKLLLFTRRDSHSLGSVELGPFFKEYDFTSSLKSNIELSVTLQPGLLPVKVMPEHLKAIIQNMLLNAANWMADGGKVEVGAYNVAVLEDDIPGIPAGKYVEISVKDDGCGINEDILENIFDPYFTTKSRDSSRGSGLGLAIVHAIVKKNNGNITVKSNKKDGTVFTVLLPALLQEVLQYREVR